jgi:hypothetical protein
LQWVIFRPFELIGLNKLFGRSIKFKWPEDGSHMKFIIIYIYIYIYVVAIDWHFLSFVFSTANGLQRTKVHCPQCWPSKCFRWVASRLFCYRHIFLWSWHVNVMLLRSTALPLGVQGLTKPIALGNTPRTPRKRAFVVHFALWLEVS